MRNRLAGIESLAPAFAEKAKAALEVACTRPRCLAPAGTACWRGLHGGRQEQDPHVQRILAGMKARRER